MLKFQKSKLTKLDIIIESVLLSCVGLVSACEIVTRDTGAEHSAE